jgi:hypothetical protein
MEFDEILNTVLSSDNKEGNNESMESMITNFMNERQKNSDVVFDLAVESVIEETVAPATEAFVTYEVFKTYNGEFKKQIREHQKKLGELIGSGKKKEAIKLIDETVKMIEKYRAKINGIEESAFRNVVGSIIGTIACLVSLIKWEYKEALVNYGDYTSAKATGNFTKAYVLICLRNTQYALEEKKRALKG